MDTPFTALSMLFPQQKMDSLTYMPLGFKYVAKPNTTTLRRFLKIMLWGAIASGMRLQGSIWIWTFQCRCLGDWFAISFFNQSDLATSAISFKSNTCFSHCCSPRSATCINKTNFHRLRRRVTCPNVYDSVICHELWTNEWILSKVTLYAAGFPCTPYSMLHWGSALLNDPEARQMYKVIDNLESCQAPVSWPFSTLEFLHFQPRLLKIKSSIKTLLRLDFWKTFGASSDACDSSMSL